MPREAARLFLRVTGVRVERLQEMRYFDFLAEGIQYGQYEETVRKKFITLWDSINGKKYPWESNPWVWVYEFVREGKRCEAAY